MAASAAAALIATVLLAGLADYNQTVIVEGGQSAIAAAPAEERALLVQGPASNPQRYQTADKAVRDNVAAGMGGVGVEVFGAGYASGRQLTGDTGNATGDSTGLIFASVMFLEGIDQRGRLIEGSWPKPGSTPAQAVLGERAASVLGYRPGSRVPITDRRTDQVTTIEISGIFAAQDPDSAYWMLTPDLAQGSLPGGTTYGPFVIDRTDFFAGTWPTGGSGGWMVEPELSGAELADLVAVRQAARELPPILPEATGMGSGLQVITSLERLVDRLQRADLVGRSALLTPLLLIVVLGGYALLLLAGLLTEQRRQETALLRARGAARGQLARLAAREALLVALPAAVLAPLLVSQLLHRIPALRDAELDPAITWSVSLAAGLGCVLAMVLPALRTGTTYVDDMASRSRPGRTTAIQRAGVDLALIAFAALAWFQLQQYDSPLAGVGGQIGIDPLLAAAAPIGVLAGAVLALRLLPPLTRMAEKLIDRRQWFATQLGMWQAGRRPHAGPVLLLALAVAVSTLAWALAGTAERSTVDQANHFAGADLRLTETSGFAPDGRPQQIAELPGVTTALPASRTSLSLGERATRVTMLALDTQAAPDVVKLREDLGDARKLFGAVTAQRSDNPSIALPENATGLRGRVLGSVSVTTYIVLTDTHGAHHIVTVPAGKDLSFDVPLPTKGLSLTGFQVEGVPFFDFNPDGEYTPPSISWTLSNLEVVTPAGAAPVSLPEDWSVIGFDQQNPPLVADGRLTAVHEQNFFNGGSTRFSVTRPITRDTVPAIATPGTLEALHKGVGDDFALSLGGPDVTVRVVGTVPTMPGTDGQPAILFDLPSLNSVYFHRFGVTRPVAEWWLTTDPAQHAETSKQASMLVNMRVQDRQVLAQKAGEDPYGVGARLALFIAALGAMALALVGITVDVRATARRRIGELAVLHTLGTSPRILARALITEQAFLAGLGVVVGLVVGVGVAALMAPLVILTPSAGRPDPEPIVSLQWTPVLGTAGVLLVISTMMAAMIALTMRNRLAAAQLRIGVDR